MYEEEDNITGMADEQQMPSDHEILEVRRALTRNHVPAPDVEEELRKLGMRNEELGIGNEEQGKGSSSFSIFHPLFRKLLAAAAILLIAFLLGSRLFRQAEDDTLRVFTANDAPVTVMLAAGDETPKAVKESTLAFNQQDAHQAVQNAKVHSPKLLTLTTPRGMDYTLTLPDGTRVWLNADSKIVFPAQFTGSTRTVTLTGEAFFEVVKDSRHPFIVNTDYFSTTVLGTSFNVRAYTEKDANVVLVEGSVKVGSRDSALVLAPNQQARFDVQDSGFRVVEVDTYPYTQWKDGFFYFDDASLLEIMQELGRWYNVNIVFEEQKDMSRRLHFVAERSLPLTGIVRSLNELDLVKVELQKDVLTVK